VAGAGPLALALCRALHEREGFRGVPEDAYYAYENSWLDRALERRTGIPITLAVVHLAVGRRVGLDLHGVNFPGHFLVRLQAGPGAEARLIDPWTGMPTTEQECEARLRLLHGQDAVLRPGEHLRAADTRGIVVRMLNNLKTVALSRRELHDALRYSTFLTLLVPGDVSQYRDRAVLHEQLGDHAAAALELERLAEQVGEGPLRDRLAQRIAVLRSRPGPIVH
jgi:regulator of sirC expression with transglutaminase-like and TPR domain